MTITDVQIYFAGAEDPGRSGPLAFANIVIDDCLSIRGFRIIAGTKRVFVSMPARKMAAPCPRCRGKAELAARFCSHCGARLPEGRSPGDKYHADVVHPTHTGAREYMEREVLAAFEAARARRAAPGVAS